ncbi:MAG: ImmA/IrrE family metallo-endopeptidase [Gemmatales bacterium]
MKAEPQFWTHPSVRLLAPAEDPVEAIVKKANDLVLDAVEKGWKGPPFDTFELANILGYKVLPCDSIRDARLVPIDDNQFKIEYNPEQSKARIRFSIAHEIAHTLFPDCGEQVRNRVARSEMINNDWQLEMLCNLGAAEFLMPLGSFPEVSETNFNVDSLLKLRERFQVSTESVFLRAVKLSRIACGVFVASTQSAESDALKVDYLRTTNDWKLPISSGYLIPQASSVNECRAIGFTSKGDENWEGEKVHVECVAIPSYPGAVNPRVVGLLQPEISEIHDFPDIQYLSGDAIEPRGEGRKIIAHVVNDTTPNWGAGFARAIANRLPTVQEDFINYVEQDRARLKLGQTRYFQVNPHLSVFNMVVQHGYGQGRQPRIRYHHLEKCLMELSSLASREGSSVHMPRIGCGQAGGNWA